MITRRDAEGALEFELLAPAKLNLFLEVLGKRPDGYHEIESLMARVNLCDRLTFADDPSGRISLSCDDPELPLDSANLVVRAAERLRRESGTARGARIELFKSIPARAGLAGGSSDAATTLIALDRLWNLQTPPGRLEALAGEIGSDVAFFLHPPAAICRGRGERTTALKPPRTLFFVLICPPVGVSTAEVYRRLNVPERPRPIGPIVAAFESGDVEALGSLFFNRLQPAAEAIEPSLSRIDQALATLCPTLLLGHQMSGSGSAYFGLGRDLEAAQAAAQSLRSLGMGRVQVVACDSAR